MLRTTQHFSLPCNSPFLSLLQTLQISFLVILAILSILHIPSFLAILAQNVKDL